MLGICSLPFLNLRFVLCVLKARTLEARGRSMSPPASPDNATGQSYWLKLPPAFTRANDNWIYFLDNNALIDDFLVHGSSKLDNHFKVASHFKTKVVFVVTAGVDSELANQQKPSQQSHMGPERHQGASRAAQWLASQKNNPYVQVQPMRFLKEQQNLGATRNVRVAVQHRTLA